MKIPTAIHDYAIYYGILITSETNSHYLLTHMEKQLCLLSLLSIKISVANPL